MRTARWIAAAGLLLAGCEGSAELAEKVAALERRQRELEARLAELEARRAPAPAAASEAGRAAPGWTELAAALEAPDAPAQVRALIGRGLDAGQAGPDGQRALVLAAAAGKLELVEALLQEGKVPLDQREEERGETALMAAATAGHTAVVELLLAAGADPTLVGGVFEGDPFATARGLAEAAGHEELARKLVEASWSWASHQGALVLMDRVVVSPMGLGAPVELAIGRQEGPWGRLSFTVEGEPLALEDDATSLGPATRNQSLYRIPLTWRQGEASGRQDVLFNHPNAGEEVMAAVVELRLPSGRVRLELEVRPLPVE